MADHSNNDAGASAGGEELTLDRIFGLLADERRRYALLCLREHQPDITLGDLADEVATYEFDCRFAEIDPSDVLDIYLALYHTHIPKLVHSGVAEYDQDQDLVMWREPSRRLDELLTWIEAELDGEQDGPQPAP